MVNLGRNISHDRLRQLRAFCQTVRLESMSKAADRLDLTQPAVSRQIRALEDEFSTRLFERRGPVISLTPSGETLNRLALPLLAAVDNLPDAFVDEIKGTVMGSVRIAAGQTAAKHILRTPIKQFQALYPKVLLRVESGDGSESLKMVRGQEIEFAVGAMESTPEDLEFRRIVSSRQVLIVPANHYLADREEASVEDLKGSRWVLPVSGTFARSAADSIARYFNTTLNVAVETNGWSLIKDYVEAGLGVAAVPALCLSASDRVATLRFEKRIDAYLRPRVYGVIMRKGASLSVAATRFLQTLDPSFTPPTVAGR